MTKYIRGDYTVKPDVDLDELKAATPSSSPASAAIFLFSVLFRSHNRRQHDRRLHHFADEVRLY